MTPKAPAAAATASGNGDVTPTQPVPKKELLYEGYFYDVTEWAKKHPGGRIIEFYTASGEDSTVAVHQFHQRSTKKVMAIMNCLKKRPASPEELNMDTERMKRNQALTKDFLQLHDELMGEGYFKPSIPHVLYRLTEVVTLAALGFHLLTNGYTGVWRIVGIVAYGLFGARCGHLNHESGHQSLTGKPKVDRFIQAMVFGIGNGMSGSWWKSQHNRHHAMPQRLEYDVDIKTLPLFAYNSKVVKNPKVGQTFLIQNQAPLMLVIGTFLAATSWKLYLHPMFVLKKGSYREFIFFGIHYYLAFQIGLVNYLLSTWIMSAVLLVNIILAHSHLPVTTEPLHWVEFGLLHTIDIQPSWWCDWWMGYMNYQVEHHLFPAMPHFRNHLIVERVKALAAKHGIPYQCLSYGEAVSRTFSNLSKVSKELRHF